MRAWFLLWVLLCALLFAAAACRLLPHEEEMEHKAHPQTPPASRAIVFEEPQTPPVATSPPAEEAVSRPEKVSLPRIAIIIDDMGYHGQVGRDLLALDLNLTFSFLPGAPFTRKQEEEAWAKGRTILLHLPMQAQSRRWDPGPGALYTTYSPQRIRSVILEDLESVPHAVGCNNHMGSGFTENRDDMHAALAVLKEISFLSIPTPRPAPPAWTRRAECRCPRRGGMSFWTMSRMCRKSAGSLIRC